ncbi:MAG: hydrolase [Chloroflexi bacterium]|nr:hydrolase [Chloroflexota bacterium]
MFIKETTALVVIDIQEKLASVMSNKVKLIEHSLKLVKGMKVLDIPIIVTEQNPKGLGLTFPGIAEELAGNKPVIKLCFSCCDEPLFVQKIKALNRNQIVLAGIEAHVCVYQTALDLISMGYEVEVAVDCIDSRTVENKEIALRKMARAGVGLTSMEMTLFELLKVAEGARFKEILKIVK